MRFEELFIEAARTDEPPIPVDVAGSVRGIARRRRLVMATLGGTFALVGAVAVALLLPSGGSPSPPPVVASPSVPAAPSAYVAVQDGRAVRLSATGLLEDYGPATSVSPAGTGAWVARSLATCSSQIELLSDGKASTSFRVLGDVSALSYSPAAQVLAYARTAVITPGPKTLGCGERTSLVLRDLRDGSERVWQGDEGGIISLSWSTDGTQLALETAICCDDGRSDHLLAITTAPTPVSEIPLVTVPELPTSSRAYAPTFAGDDLLFLFQDFNADAEQYRVITRTGDTVLVLQEFGVGLSSDRSGRNLLITLYGDPERSGSLLSFADRQTVSVFGRGLTAATWTEDQ